MRLFMVWLVAAIVPVGGCRLIDQRSFERTGRAPGAAELARSAAQATAADRPLATVRPGEFEADWRPALLEAARAALGRAPDTRFDVTALAPLHARPDEGVEAARTDARDVGKVLEADGVPAEHIHLGVRGDAGDPPREVLVFAR